MLKWFSGEEGEPGSGGPGSPHRPAGEGGELAVEEMSERLSQTEQLVSQLKEMIREKDATLRTKDEQLKTEKEACEAKLSKLRLQNKAKVTSLNNQLEELKKLQGGPDTPTRSKKGSSEGGEQASRGKIVLLKKKVEDLEQQLAQRDTELENKRKEVESFRQRGEEIDTMLTEKDRKLAEKEAYIVHLQVALAGDQPVSPVPQEKAAEEGGLQEIQPLLQSLTKKVGEAEERYSLLQEQTDSLKELLVTEKEQYAQKENMYKQNIQTFKDIIIQKDNQLMEINQMHEQELFKLAAKSDASADLEHLLKALKQKLHEKEEVLLGKTQVIDVLQQEVDGRDQQIKDLSERLRRLQVERESLESKMEAEKHVMRAQLRDLMEKQQAEVQRLSEQHRSQMDLTQYELHEHLEELKRASAAATAVPPASQDAPVLGSMSADSASIQRIAELEAQAKQKTDEAGRSEAKFLKMKAWSKSRIRQLEDELKRTQAGVAPPDLTDLRSHITALEEEREENLWKAEQYEELQNKNEMLEAKLVVYEEQQRTLQADLEQFTKRAASQASESGSADDTQSQVLEWQEMVSEAVSAKDRAKEEKAAMALRISNMEEEREALETRQQELEEELAQSRGLGQHRAKKLPAQRSLQEDFEFDGQVPFQDPRSTSESTTPMEGENMGGWWPEYSSPDTDGLRSVVEELELERNQLQEQILSLEERCQDLEDRLQLQARIESLQNETERLQSQLATVRSQQSRDAEKHQLTVNSLNEQLKGLSDTQECLESSLIEKENTLAKTSEKLELISSLRESLSQKESQYKEVSDRLLQTEHTLDSISVKCGSTEKQCSELKMEVSDLTQKLSVLKEKTQKQEVTIEALQTELDQTNEELDKLNSAHLAERAQLIHDLQTCEREIDSLREVVSEKDKEISTLSANMAEYWEQVTVLKQEVKLKEESLVQVEMALRKAEQEATIIRDSQSSDQQALNSRITEALEKLKEAERELVEAKEERSSKESEVEHLIKQLEDDKKSNQELRGEIQKQTVSHRRHLSECETHITSLKEQLGSSTQKLQESEGLISQLKDKNINSEKLLQNKEETYEKELKSVKEEQNKLLVQVEKYNDKIQTLSKQLEERAQNEEQIKREMQEKVETLMQQLKSNSEQTEEERKKRESEKQKLSNQIKNNTEHISKLKNLLKNVKTEKQQVSEQLELQKQNATELNDKVKSVLELNGTLESQLHCLTEEKHRLEVEVSESMKSISHIRVDKESFQEKLSTLETQCSENDRIINGLEKDKEELTGRVNELNKILEQSAHSNSEMLLEKTNECSRLREQLREQEEEVRELQEHKRNLKSEVEQLQRDKAESATELVTQLEAEQKQRATLEETLIRLRGEESSLRVELKQRDAALKEKQGECQRLQGDIAAEQNAVSALQEEHSQQCQKHKDELNASNEKVKAQGEEIRAVKEKLESEAERRNRSDKHLQTLTEENNQLRVERESREKELVRQTQLSSELDSRLKSTLEENSSLSMKISKLTEDTQRLREELNQNLRSVSDLNAEISLLHEKNSGLETQISNDEKTISSLLREKDELNTVAEELRNILSESELSNASGLIEKTNECANLTKKLQEGEEQLQRLQGQVSQLSVSLTEKEEVLTTLQDTVSALREQGSVLKSGLMEKEALMQQKAHECGIYQKEVALQKELMSKLQGEVESVRKECVDMKQTSSQREEMLSKVSKELQSHKDELNKRNESVISLSTQLGTMNENAVETEAEISNLKEAVQKLMAEKLQLTQGDDQRKAEITDFKDSIQALNEQNTRLKSELLTTVTVLSTAQQEVANLKKSVSDMEMELKAALSDQDALNLSVRGKDDTLRQQERLIQQLNGRIAEQEQLLQHNTSENVSLHTKVSEMEDSVSKLQGQVDSLLTTLETKEQSSLEFQSHSSAAVENLNSQLQVKVAECESLKEQLSHLRESVSKLDGALQTHTAESENLKRALTEKEAAHLELSKSLQDAQTRADEASLFKSQFMESTELVSELQNQTQVLSAESENYRKSAEETHSAFKNLQEKYATNLDELQDNRKRLSHQVDEVSNLQKLLDDTNKEHQMTMVTIETLRKDLSVLQHKLEKSEYLNASLSKEKDEAFSSHQANVSLLTVEIEHLKSQHLQVATHMNALTENLEQREMALHAINSQYTSQAKHTSQLVSEMQKLEEQNKRLSEEMSLMKVEQQKHLSSVGSENSRLQEEVRKLLAEREELERSHQQIQTTQLHMEQQSGSMKAKMQQMVSETESLQAKVSAKDQELSRLTANIQKIEQILQDSEREWLLVLEKEKQDKNVMAEQLRSVDNEMKSKDVKVNALKQDLDSLQDKLAEASSAVRLGSDQLSAKELEASASRVQLEKVLALFQEKDRETNGLQQALKTAEFELEKLLARKCGSEKGISLIDMIKQLEERHDCVVKDLKARLDEIQNEGGRSERERGQKICRLQDAVENLQMQLSAESEKVKSASIEHSSLFSEVQAKDQQINSLGIQINQQKELLSGLSQQMKDNDASVTQVMESASNERVKLCEEKASLMARIESMQQEQQTLRSSFEETSRHLEDQISRAKGEIDAKNSEILALFRQHDDVKSELAKVTKEKEALKKKLQAALVVRKDLLKKIEEYENQKEESLNSGKTEVSLLQEKLRGITDQSQQMAKSYQEEISDLKHVILEKEGEMVEHKTQSERLFQQLQSEQQLLETTLTEKEKSLFENLQTLSKKTSAIEQLQITEKSLLQERNGLVRKVEELQIEIGVCKNKLKEKSSSAASAIMLENELAQAKSEKAILQKKAQAALLARKEMMKKAQENEKKLTQELAELKDDYKALLEQRCQQTNELNAIQLNLDERVRESENLQRTLLSYLDELDTLRQLVEERDKNLQDLKMSLAEKESQCHSLSHLQTELETIKAQAGNISVEMLSKEEALLVMEQREEALKSQFEKVQKVLQERTEEIENYRQLNKDREDEDEQRNIRGKLEEKCKILTEEKGAALEQRNRMQVELETALALVSQKSLEVLNVQKMLTETQQQVIEGKCDLTKELKKAQLHQTDTERILDSLKQEKESALQSVHELKDEAMELRERLKEVEMLNEQLRQEMPEKFEVELKERDEALSDSRAQIVEKDKLITALEEQLRQQLKMHECAVERMKVEACELQRSQEDSNKTNDQDNQSKINLLTRKLQAALVSRKELQKENATLKEEVEKLSGMHEAKKAEIVALESSMGKLEQQNADLETSVFSLKREKDAMNSQVDSVHNENCSLSAACNSLKLTIESITQQKQAFSCQVESLQDSQTEELSKWKSKHAELRQEYESLLQAYENVSSEMDKMRQLLEGAKRDRQEAIHKAHKQEVEVEMVKRKCSEMQEENERVRVRMQKSSKEKQQLIEELEEENQRIQQQLSEHEGKQETAMFELTDKNKELEDKICRLTEFLDDLRGKLAETQTEKIQLEEEMEEARNTLEKKHTESNEYSVNMQLKLGEALSLNNNLMAQIEAQKTEMGAQLEINKLLQKEKLNLSKRIEEIQNDHELQLGNKDDVIGELRDVINRHSQETISLNETVRILEDDKCLLQEELENVQETSDKVKNENEYLETVILKNSERIDELTETLKDLQTQSAQLSSQLAATKERSDLVRQEKEAEQLKLVREFEEKLKTVQRGNEGSKNVRKELQELLKEKHQEINQLQQNYIRYQEVILDLESSLKSSRLVCDHLEREVKKGSERMSALEERSKESESKLAEKENLLQEATERIQTLESEKQNLVQEMSQQSIERNEKIKSPQTDDRQINSYMQNQFVMQQQIEDLKELSDQESQKVIELRQNLDSQELQINSLKRAAETNEAKLSALSSTPQGADAVRRWNDLYQKTLNEKDNQLLEQGFVIKRFLEDMRVKDKEVNELRVTKSRLERTLNEYSVASAAQQRQLFVMSASNAELSESAELLAVQVKELGARVGKTEQDKNALNRTLADKEDVISRIQLNLQQVEKINADTDAQLLHLQTQNDKLQADVDKQEGISLQLKTLLQGKDAEISSLLSCRDGQVSGYLEQLQTNYRLQVAVYEDRLTSLRYQREKSDKETRGLESKVKSLQIKASRSMQEKEQMVAKMESFKNSMVSLQSERERLMSEYRILEAKSELGLKGKDGSSDGEGGAAKGLKHEIRKLLHQMDDLNSENAMLRAQLVRYREDLNQVLSLKDNQLKVLLKKQQDVIKNLENQRSVADKQHRETRLELQKEEEANESLRAEVSKLTAQVSNLEFVTSAQTDGGATDVGKVILDLQQAVAAKSAECNELQQKVLSQKNLTDELKGKMHKVENETDKKLAEAEDKYNTELDTFEREVEMMRNEQETSDRRVEDLAKDLLQAEQQLSEVRTQSKDMKAQNESLCKAMVALQNDRDQLIEDFKVLRNRYDEELRESQAALKKVERSLQDATSDLAMFGKERDILARKVGALESKDVNVELNKLMDELSKALAEKEKELKQATLENGTLTRQLSSFSRSMASLQNDRERLMDELAGTKTGAVESRQGSSLDLVRVEAGSDVSFLQSERDGRTLIEHQHATRESEAEVSSCQEAKSDLGRADSNRKDSPPIKQQELMAPPGGGVTEEVVARLEAEKVQLHRDLQRCVYEIQQRDQFYQQLNTSLHQAVEEKGAVAVQLRVVSQTLRDSQNRCQWLERQVQSQGSVYAEVAPGAPQERSSESVIPEPAEAIQLRERLLEVEQYLADERTRRETAEEALRLAEDRAKSVGGPRDFSIEMDTEEEWEALSLDPNQPLITRQVKGGMAACRRWLRGRSLYFSRLLTSRTRSRYFFLFYLLTIHALVLMCFTGAL